MSWCFTFPKSISMPTVISRLREVEFIEWIHLRNVLFIRFVKFEIKQWFSAYQDQFWVWSSLARLRTAWVFFSELFSNKETALPFFFLLDYASCACLGLDNTYFYLLFAQSCKILSKFSKLSAILKHRGKNPVMMPLILHLFSNRS